MKEFVTILELSEYLNIKKSSLYAGVESGEIPHYRIGRLIRFKMSEVEAWMRNHSQVPSDANKKAKELLKARDKPVADVNHLVKKTIAEIKGNRYTPSHRETRPNQGPQKGGQRWDSIKEAKSGG